MAMVKGSNDVSITEHPAPKSVMLGSSVIIPCRIRNLPVGIQVEWLKNGFILGDVKTGGNYFESLFVSDFQSN